MQAEQPPRLGGIQAGPAIAGLLYVLLVGSAALALWAREFPGGLPPGLERAAPWVFLAFIICFAGYRLALVRARKYPAFKAFFQIGAAALFFVLLLPGTKTVARTPSDDLAELMQDSNPRVRAIAAELTPHREQPQRYESQLVRLLHDPDQRVRTQAHRALVEITGEDLGPPDQPGAVKAWGERFK